jgi:hypothetical protein
MPVKRFLDMVSRMYPTEPGAVDKCIESLGL